MTEFRDSGRLDPLPGPGPVAPSIPRAALEGVRVAESQQRQEDFKARIRELERAGKWEDALRLTAEWESTLQTARDRG
jgi:hypothetical protein